MKNNCIWCLLKNPHCEPVCIICVQYRVQLQLQIGLPAQHCSVELGTISDKKALKHICNVGKKPSLHNALSFKTGFMFCLVPTQKPKIEQRAEPALFSLEKPCKGQIKQTDAHIITTALLRLSPNMLLTSDSLSRSLFCILPC